MAWRALIDTHDPSRPNAGSRLPTAYAFERAPRSLSPKRRSRAAVSIPDAPAVETIDKLASEAGIGAEWFDVSGKRTIVSAETKIALLGAIGLDVASEAQARESLTRARRRDRSAAACPSRLCCASTSRSSRLCATCRAQPTRGSSERTATSPNGPSSRGGRAARPARRTLRLRARDRAAEAADRPLPPHCRWRRMRAHHRAAGGL